MLVEILCQNFTTVLKWLERLDFFVICFPLVDWFFNRDDRVLMVFKFHF